MYYVITFKNKKVIDVAEYEEPVDALNAIKCFRIMEDCTDFQDIDEKSVLIIEGETLTIGLCSF